MVITVSLLLLILMVPRAQPLVKVGARAPVRGVFIEGTMGRCLPLEKWGEILELELYFCFECRLNLVLM